MATVQFGGAESDGGLSRGGGCGRPDRILHRTVVDKNVAIIQLTRERTPIAQAVVSVPLKSIKVIDTFRSASTGHQRYSVDREVPKSRFSGIRTRGKHRKRANQYGGLN